MDWTFIRKRGGNFRAYRRRFFVMSLVLLIPVLIISLVNFWIIRQQNDSAVESSLRISSQRRLELMNQQMDIIQKVVDQYKKDDGFLTWDQTDLLTTYFDVKEALNRDSIWTSFFSDVSYYNVKDGYIISLRGMEDENYYFSNVSVMDGNRGAASVVRPGTVVPVRAHSRLQNRDGVVFFVPFETGAGNRPVSAVLFTVFDGTLDSMWENDYGGGSFMTLFYDGVPFFSTDRAVNDRIYSRKDLSALIDPPGGSKLYRYSDKGLTVQWNIGKAAFASSEVGLVTRQALVTFLVLIVGFMSLSYYSRKSYQPLWDILEKLPEQYRRNTVADEYEYLDAVLSDLAYSKSFLEETNNELRQEKYLYYILDNQVSPGGALFRQCLNAGIRVDRRYFVCILLDDAEDNQELYEFLTAGEKPERNDRNIYSMYIMGNRYLFLLCADGSRKDLNSFLRGLPGEGHRAVSEIVEGVRNVRRAYAGVCANEMRFSQPAVPQRYPELELESLKEAVSVDNADKVEFSLRMIKNNLPCYSEIMRAFVFAAICEILDEGDREREGRQMQWVRSADAESVSRAVDALFSDWLHGKQAERPPLVRRTAERSRSLHSILQYIQKNVTDPNFSIKYMAAEFGTSPSNLSHYFKKVTGKTLSGFIDELRIEKAEKYLAKGEKVSVVAEKMGYNSTSVFIEAFKRLRGTTPSAYRTGEGASRCSE